MPRNLGGAIAAMPPRNTRRSRPAAKARPLPIAGRPAVWAGPGPISQAHAGTAWLPPALTGIEGGARGSPPAPGVPIRVHIRVAFEDVCRRLSESLSESRLAAAAVRCGTGAAGGPAGRRRKLPPAALRHARARQDRDRVAGGSRKRQSLARVKTETEWGRGGSLKIMGALS